MKIPEVNITDENTKEDSTDRIWIRVSKQLYVPVNRESKRNNPTPSEFIDAINKAVKEQIKNGVHNITLYPYLKPGVPYHSCDQTYIILEGWKIESDTEYFDRIKSLESRAERALEESIRQIKLICFRAKELEKFNQCVSDYKARGKKVSKTP